MRHTPLYRYAMFRLRYKIAIILEHWRLSIEDEALRFETSVRNPSISSMQIAFRLAVEACQAFNLFGGFCAQINQIIVVLNIAIVANPCIAIWYDEAIGSRLASFARERTPNIDYTEILRVADVELKRSLIQSASNNANAAQRLTTNIATATNSTSGGNKCEGPKEGRGGKSEEASSTWSVSFDYRYFEKIAGCSNIKRYNTKWTNDVRGCIPYLSLWA